MKAKIEWDFDIEDILEKLDSMTAENAAEALEIPYQEYVNMNTSEIHDYAYDVFEYNRDIAMEFLGLPEEVEIPDFIENDEDDISDWLSDEYGFCQKGFVLIKE